MKKNIIVIGLSYKEIISISKKKIEKVNLFVICDSDTLPINIRSNKLKIEFFNTSFLNTPKFLSLIKKRDYYKIIVFNNFIKSRASLNNHNSILDTCINPIKTILMYSSKKKLKTSLIFCIPNKKCLNNKKKIITLNEFFNFIYYEIIKSYKEMFKLNIKFYLFNSLKLKERKKVISYEI